MLRDRIAESPRLWLNLPRLSLDERLSGEAELAARLRDRAPSFELADLSPLLSSQRVRKDAGEIALIRKAVAATVAAQRAAAAAIAPGVSEGLVEGTAYAALKAAGAEGWSFTPIVAGGANGAILHYDANLDVFAEGQVAVVDLGASYGGYAGDLTRTYPVSGRFTARQLEVYEAVRRAHDEVVETIRPGDTISRMRDLAWESLEKSEVAGPGGCGLGAAFVHGLGHFLGLDVHDCGSESMTLEPGMVLTNEPGAYLADEGFGVRIENDLLITSYGVEDLSAELPLEPAAVAAMVAGS
jgi:Xaa-Pro aminopeptidase